MCGIFGVVNYGGKLLISEIGQVKQIVANLLDVSECRGRDASGICVVSGDKALVFKNHVRGGKLVEDPAYKKIMESIKYDNNFRYMFGHTRMMTKGHYRFNVNNHPIVVDKIIGVHNGCISNDDDIFNVDKTLKRIGQVDSEVIFQLLNKFMKEDPNIEEAIKKTYKALTGSMHVVFIHTDYKKYLNIFTGGEVHFVNNKRKSIMAFASSSHILNRAVQGFELFRDKSDSVELKFGSACRIDTSNGKVHLFSVRENVTAAFSAAASRYDLSDYECPD